MGLMIYSLDNIPESARRDYFIYLLDYGWDEPISEALRKNFDRMAQQAATNGAVIIRGTEASHFSNEVFSWHHINGLDGEEILPALLITNKHPGYFRNHEFGERWGRGLLNESQDVDIKLILVPFRRFCRTSTEAVGLIQSIFDDIKSQKDLFKFSIAKEIKKEPGRAIVDAMVLEPNFAGIGINLKKVIGAFLK